MTITVRGKVPLALDARNGGRDGGPGSGPQKGGGNSKRSRDDDDSGSLNHNINNVIEKTVHRTESDFQTPALVMEYLNTMSRAAKTPEQKERFATARLFLKKKYAGRMNKSFF